MADRRLGLDSKGPRRLPSYSGLKDGRDGDVTLLQSESDFSSKGTSAVKGYKEKRSVSPCASDVTRRGLPISKMPIGSHDSPASPSLPSYHLLFHEPIERPLDSRLDIRYTTGEWLPYGPSPCWSPAVHGTRSREGMSRLHEDTHTLDEDLYLLFVWEPPQSCRWGFSRWT